LKKDALRWKDDIMTYETDFDRGRNYASGQDLQNSIFICPSFVLCITLFRFVVTACLDECGQLILGRKLSQLF